MKKSNNCHVSLVRSRYLSIVQCHQVAYVNKKMLEKKERICISIFLDPLKPLTDGLA